MQIRENVLISDLTTMRLGGRARFVATAETAEDVMEIYQFAGRQNLPVWVMGGGANTIGRDEGFPGVILLNRIKGIETSEEVDDKMTITAMAGEIWNDLVVEACRLGFSGIEAMAAIPGTVGAAPVQNIGAYGQDIAQVIRSVQAYDTHTQRMVTLEKSEMRMEYRHTRFNYGEDAGRFVIVTVTLELKQGELQPPFYTSLQNYVEEHHETDFSPENIRRMVSEIRAEKLPDPAKIASAGSFFKNVYIDADEAERAEEAGIPVWCGEDGLGKINSGWLIEACGLKGRELYGFRVSEKAALVLINESARSYADLAKARTEIVNTVRAKFGYTLEQEPVELV